MSTVVKVEQAEEGRDAEVEVSGTRKVNNSSSQRFTNRLEDKRNLVVARGSFPDDEFSWNKTFI